MVWLKVVSIDKVIIKGRGKEIFRKKSVRPASCESILKIQRHLGQLLAIRILTAKAAMKFIAP
jgi:hypothetical protein